MKKLILSITLLSNITLSFSCGWWPSGEEIRFSLFSSELAGQDELSPLFYSNQYFNNYGAKDFNGPKENIVEWEHYFYNKFSSQTIDHVIYSMQLDGNYKNYLNNPLFKYLAEGNQPEVSEYILFAKKVELLLDIDPWNRNNYNAEQLKIAQSIALKHAENSTNYRLKNRFAYQYITISYYLNDTQNVKYGFNYFFKNSNETVLKYWAMLYYANVQDSNINRLYLLSKVFTHSKSKCKYIYTHFSKNDSIINLVLQKCKTDKERAGVLSIQAFQNPGRTLKQIKEISSLDPELDLLDILLIREVNKLENWYLTYRYTSYLNPTYYSNTHFNNNQIRVKKLESDKKYLIQFIKTCIRIEKKENTRHKALWNTSIAYLYYMIGNQKQSEIYLKMALNHYPSNEIKAQIELISLLNFTDKSNLTLPKKQNELMDLLNNLNFLKPQLKDQIMLAISSNQILKGNIALGALLESKNFNKVDKYDSWKSQKEQVFNVLNNEGNSKNLDTFFEIWNKPNKSKLETYLLDSIQDYKWHYTDLWATQYFREDKLEKALEIYSTIPEEFWHRDSTEMSFYKIRELKSNPFSSNFYGLQRKENSKVRYTKPQFVQAIIDIKHKLKHNKNNKSYHALLLGNAYYNMTIHGNSPYYTEYYSRYPSFEKDKKSKRIRDYFYTCTKAIKFYKLAEKYAPNRAYKAFCFRMVVKCISQANHYSLYNTNNMEIKKSIWKKFKTKYPKHYNNLQGCDHFDFYSNAWKQKSH